MNSGIRIIKHANGFQAATLLQSEKTAPPSEREIANAVKNWIVELGQRRRIEHTSLARCFVLQPKIERQ